MASWTTTRSGKGGHFQLYRGRVKTLALRAFERAEPEAGTVVLVTEHRDRTATVIRRSDGGTR
jgi:hypothetical protein